MTSQALTHKVLRDVEAERLRQFRKHGSQFHLPDGTGPGWNLFGEVDRLSDDGVQNNRHLAEVAKQRCKEASQDEGGNGSITFEHILTEEWAEAMAEEDPGKLREELVQVAAVAVQWIEKLDLAKRQAEVAAYGG